MHPTTGQRLRKLPTTGQASRLGPAAAKAGRLRLREKVSKDQLQLQLESFTLSRTFALSHSRRLRSGSPREEGAALAAVPADTAPLEAK